MAFVNTSLNIILNNKECSEHELIKIKYGLEGLYSFVTKYTFILLLNILLGTTLEFIVFHVTYAIIRAFGFGLHAKTNLGCWIISTISFVIIPFIIKNIFISKLILFVIGVIATVIIIIFAPADTKKRPLIHKDKRMQNKVISIIICLLYLCLIYILNNFIVNCLAYALLFESLMINPLSYMISKQSFNNYKKMNV